MIDRVVLLHQGYVYTPISFHSLQGMEIDYVLIGKSTYLVLEVVLGILIGFVLDLGYVGR